jgi:hypothetical protein
MRQTSGVERRPMASVHTPVVRIVTGLNGGAWLRRGVLYVGRARTAEATQRRVERALAAVQGRTPKE